MAGIFTKAYFHDEAAAFAELESIVWPNGPHCPHCGATDRLNRLAPQRTKPSKLHPEGKPVIGLWKCYHCRKQFTVRVGTVFESSHVPLHLWLQAAFLMCSSKKGISSNQLHRTLGVTLKTAWFMSHRLREAMRDGSLAPMGGAGSIMEVDETFIGIDRAKKPRGEKKGRGYAHKHKVLSLVERGGRARSMVVDDLKAKTIIPILAENIARETRVMTDEAGQYTQLGKVFEHRFVRHGEEEYVNREDPTIHTNTIEGFFSVFKRGMKGVYQHCGKKHLHRYLAEFDFRYNERQALEVNDLVRTDKALRGIVGKRLTYRDSSIRP